MAEAAGNKYANNRPSEVIMLPWIQHYWELTRETPRYADPLRLLRFGAKAYSQHDEDGILAEIFRRIGVTTRTFVEVGTGDGIENNTLTLLFSGWRGGWVDGNSKGLDIANRRLSWYVEHDRLTLENQFVTRANIDAILTSVSPSVEPDLLSIDVDGNDYWLWQAIQSLQPRAVVIEYNATWFPPLAVTVPYDDAFRWDGTNYFGASLKALELLGTQKGYHLVGCDFSGSNAFFVRRELCLDRFRAPFDAENHFEPPRYWMTRPCGHLPSVSRLVSVADVPDLQEVTPIQAMPQGEPVAST